MPVQIIHFCPLLQVYDMPEAIHFYCDLLGLELLSNSEEVDAPEGRHFQWAHLRLGSATLMLNTAHDVGDRPACRDTQREQAHGDTELYLTCNDIGSVFEELQRAGLRVQDPQSTRYGMTQLRLLDPDGYCVCFQQPT